MSTTRFLPAAFAALLLDHPVSSGMGSISKAVPAPGKPHSFSPAAGCAAAVSALLVAQAYMATEDKVRGVHRPGHLPPCPVAMLDATGFPVVVDGRQVYIDQSYEGGSLADVVDECWDRGMFSLIRGIRGGSVVLTTLVEYGTPGRPGARWEQVFPRPDGSWFMLDDEGLEVTVAFDEARPCWLFQVSPKEGGAK